MKSLADVLGVNTDRAMMEEDEFHPHRIQISVLQMDDDGYPADIPALCDDMTMFKYITDEQYARLLEGFCPECRVPSRLEIVNVDGIPWGRCTTVQCYVVHT